MWMLTPEGDKAVRRFSELSKMFLEHLTSVL